MNHNRPVDAYDPDRTDPEAYDDRDEPDVDMFEDSGFNQPEDAVAHL